MLLELVALFCFIIVFRSFPQENEKNSREPLISVKLISGSLFFDELIPIDIDVTAHSHGHYVRTCRERYAFSGYGGKNTPC